MKCYKGALPWTLLGLALCFPACATSPGTAKLPTLSEAEAPRGLVSPVNFCVPEVEGET
ncbi:MAG TPA: hypothetical protein VIN67_01695 [Desulfobaccales bacterium]